MVVTSIPIPSRLFPNIRSLPPSLLFQFLLREFLTSYTALQELEALYNGSTLKREEPRLGPAGRKKMLEAVTELCGEVMSFAPTFPWTVHQGSLKALVHYCHLFQRKQSPAPLVERSERAYRQAVLCRTHLLSWTEQQTLSDVHIRALIRALHSLFRNLHKIGQYLARELPQYGHDENVVFFLLRHREEFDTLFHAPFVISLLEKMYRGGIDQAEQHLIRQYTKRGFDNLLPLITKAFADVRHNLAE